jgi:polysaccharide biosynthesis transport protein
VSAAARAPAVAAELPPGPPSVELRWLLAALRCHRRLVLLATAATTVIAAAVAYGVPPRYTARALVRLQDARAPLVQGILDPVDARQRALTDPILSEIQVLTSRSLASQIVDHPDAVPLRVHAIGFPSALLDSVRPGAAAAPDSLRLRFTEREVVVTGRGGERRAAYGTPLEVDGVRFTLTAAPGVGEGLLVVVPRDAAVDTLLAHLEVSPRARTDLLDVGFTARDPVVAMRVANAAVQVFQAASIETGQRQARRRREFMEEQLRQNDSILTIAQRALSDFRGRNRAYSSQEMFAAGREGLAGLELQRVNLDIEYRTYQALLADLTRDDGTAAARGPRVGTLSAGAAENPVIAQLYTQLLRHQAVYDSLTTGEYRSAEGSPDVRRAATLIGSSRERLVEAVRSYAGSLGARLEVLDGARTARAAAFQRIPAAEVEEARLAMRLEALRKVGDQLREEYQRTRIDEAAQAGGVQIIDAATPPRSPAGIGPLMTVALGLVLGLLLGGGAAVLRETLNTVIRRREDVEDALQLPWLAVIPRIRSPGRRSRRGGAAARGAVAGGNGHRLASLFARDEQESAIERAFAADAFRVLQVNLVFASDEQAAKVIAVTSPMAQDGKTTTAINLAVAYAERGSRVLLVDCDLRRPRLHRLSGQPRDPGLTELVLGRCDAQRVVRPLSHNLWLLAAGVMPPNPPALLGSARMREVLGSLAREYDVLVLDCPPTLLGADAAVVGALADGVLFVVRAGHTGRDMAQDALEQLRRVGARVLGAALNDPESLVPGYSYDMYEEYKEHYHSPERVVQSASPSASSR